MIIRNASAYTEEGFFQERDIYIEGDRFVEDIPGAGERTEVDASGCYAIPGLTDIHFHGCGGYDFCDGTEEALEHMAAYEAEHGVTNIVPAAMTLPEEDLLNICKKAGEYCRKKPGEGRARLQGIHLEGPFLSIAKKGAQNEAYIRKADVGMFDRLNAASGGMVKLVVLAPEEQGAMEFMERKRGEVRVSLGHTCAGYETAMEAFRRGASHVTHLYNAMNPYTHRAPGLVGAAADSGAEVELICDGVHLHPAAVRTTFKIFGDDKIIFISDSMRAAGLGDGDYRLGGLPVKVAGKLATLEDGTLAGSVTNLLDCMRTAVLGMGIPLESAVKCAAVNPARCVGIDGDYGSIAPLKKADLVLLRKEDLKLEGVVMDGVFLS